MLLFSINLLSKALHKQTEVNVLLPNNTKETSCLKTIWVLHGMTDDNTGWLRKSDIENLAERYGVCVVMPNADLSFYVNMAYGGDYSDYIASELPDFLRMFFPISDKKEDNYIAGVSMGGYGAFRIAMSNPDKYNAAISFSGPMCISWIYRILANEDLLINKDIENFIKDNKDIPKLLVESLVKDENLTIARIFKGMFGTNSSLPGNENDIYYLADRLAECRKNLKLIAYCGTEDYHYQSNLDFEKYSIKLGLDYKLITGPGDHTWKYWNEKIPDMMNFLFA